MNAAPPHLIRRRPRHLRVLRGGVLGAGVSRFDVFLMNLDPTIGIEIRPSRPCVVVSPDEMNRYVRTVVVAPLTTSRRPYPSRVQTHFAGKDGQVVIDQLRTVDKARLAEHLGVLEPREAATVLEVLREFFAP